MADLAFFQLLGGFYTKTLPRFLQEVSVLLSPQSAPSLRMKCFGSDLACLLGP